MAVNVVRAQSDSANLAKIIKESGVDPTKVQSRASYSVIIWDPLGPPIQVINKFVFNLGINRWNFSVKYDLVSNYTNDSTGTFQTGSGDIKFGALNAFFVKGKHALAGAAELVIPTGRPGKRECLSDTEYPYCKDIQC